MVVDGGRAPEVVAEEVGRLVDSGRVEAVAGWHISAVRQAITRRVGGGRVVYAFAAMHEGGDPTPGVFMIGERPINQAAAGRALDARGDSASDGGRSSATTTSSPG
ncbi:ABC transporter substrate-binding protein [Nocardioides convexus]|uniref:ABC transporter substrate-binding protein n=1 Tax=Nocardioides convexus TaxID=2712224 RepID=UPI00241837E3|nr:ABC transporter substrate-binding protein [Nocardioides convexus]